MAKAARSGGTHLLPGLPDEIVVGEILLRLDPKSLHHCRAVSSRDLLLARHARQPTLPLLHGYNDFADAVECLDIIPFDHGHRAADQLRYIAAFTATASSSSTPATGFSSSPSTTRTSPSTTRPPVSMLPSGSSVDGFMPLGMYRHGPTSEYRLLLHPFQRPRHDEPPSPDAQDGGYVFSLGSGELPRYIGSDTEELIYLSAGSVLFHGSLHWYVNYYYITVFDTISESLRIMPYPIVVGCADLFEMGGVLAMFGLDYEGTSVEIWVMQDYQAEVWALKYRVKLPVAEISLQFGKLDHPWEVVATSSWDGDVLVLIKFTIGCFRLTWMDSWLPVSTAEASVLLDFDSNKV